MNTLRLIKYNNKIKTVKGWSIEYEVNATYLAQKLSIGTVEEVMGWAKALFKIRNTGKICENPDCENIIVSKTLKTRFCGYKCSNKYRKLYDRKILKTRICNNSNCGKEFNVYSENRTAVHCCRECWNDAIANNVKENSTNKFKVTKAIRNFNRAEICDRDNLICQYYKKCTDDACYGIQFPCAAKGVDKYIAIDKKSDSTYRNEGLSCALDFS